MMLREDPTRVTRSLAQAPVAPTGRFRVYLGLAAGVGKTYAMLDEAHRRLERGTDVVVAVVNTHGRPLTAARLAGLETVPLASVTYRGTTFREMDLAAVLARRPEVALVDELAHTNVPGSGKNEKRWQDVLELLAADIGVISTINIQHVESLADVVERLTGVPVRERVPDEVLLRADQIELVDSSPEQLRRRMLHGNIYPPERAARALGSFFRTDTLTALRELTLRFLADEIDDELIERLIGNGTASWEAGERVLVGVGPGSEAAGVLRRAARIAARLKADLYAVHVRRPDSSPADPDSARSVAVAELHALADHLGAYWHEVEGDAADALMQFAKAHRITQIVIGHSQRSRWWWPFGGAVARRLTRHAEAAAIDLHIVTRDPATTATRVDS
jgi:two-component system sensor histidine kinase KdpD